MIVRSSLVVQPPVSGVPVAGATVNVVSKVGREGVLRRAGVEGG